MTVLSILLYVLASCSRASNEDVDSSLGDSRIYGRRSWWRSCNCLFLSINARKRRREGLDMEGAVAASPADRWFARIRRRDSNHTAPVGQVLC